MSKYNRGQRDSGLQARTGADSTAVQLFICCLFLGVRTCRQPTFSLLHHWVSCFESCTVRTPLTTGRERSLSLQKSCYFSATLHEVWLKVYPKTKTAGGFFFVVFLHRSAVVVVLAGFFIDKFGNGCKFLHILMNKSAEYDARWANYTIQYYYNNTQPQLFLCRGSIFVLLAVCFWLLALCTGLPLQRNPLPAATHAHRTICFWCGQWLFVGWADLQEVLPRHPVMGMS